MKYKRMFCWVRPHEKKELKNEIGNKFPVVFAKNKGDFEALISNNDYLVVSLSKVKSGYNGMRALFAKYPANYFHFYAIRDEEFFSANQFFIMEDEPNVIPGQYLANELVNNYLGIIPDLWEMRENSPEQKEWVQMTDKVLKDKGLI